MTHAADVSTTSGARTIDHRGSGPLPPGARIPRGLLVHRGDHAETVTAASSGNELTGVQWISFDTATHQQSGVEVAADISWSMFLENFITGPSRLLALTTEPPQAPQASEDWRSGLARLRSWRGDRTVGEARDCPRRFLKAKAVGLLTEQTARSHGMAPAMHVVPLYDGGLLCEWTERGSRVEHFEIGISPSSAERYEVLATTETLDRHIDRVHHDTEGATLFEALGRFAEFLERLRSIA